jgi:hypothetical protein
MPLQLARCPRFPVTNEPRREMGMSYTVTDIADLIDYHLVASTPGEDHAHASLSRLVGAIQSLSARPLWREATWAFCVLGRYRFIHPDGHHYSNEGDIYCADCWSSDEELR